MPVMRPVTAMRRVFWNANVKPASAPGQLHQRIVQTQHDGPDVVQLFLVDHGDQLLLVKFFIVGERGHLRMIRGKP